VGEKMKIYNGIAYTQLQEVICTGLPINNVQITLPTSETMYALFATLADAAGNISNPSTIAYLIKDASIESASGIPDLDSLYDFGTSSTDNITRETQPKLIATCAPGSTVSFYDNTTILIGTSSCMGNSAQMIPVLPLSAGVHSLSTKQTSSAGFVSPASAALALTIDTAPLTVTVTKKDTQASPTSNATIAFIATFSRAIDTNSFVCSDVTVTNATCTSVTLVSGYIYTINVTATSPGVIRAIIYTDRVETVAGNLNTESTGANTITYSNGTNGQCRNIETYATSTPT
jgi:hypothetical protein